MVNFTPEYSPEAQQTQVPDFSRWATPHDTAQYFRSIGQPEKAEAAIRGAAGTPDKVFYILTQPWVGGFKEVGKTGVQYVNLDTLGTRFQWEVHTHEWVHNTQEAVEGEIGIASFDYCMTPARQAIIYPDVGVTMSLSETDLVEWLTQRATQVEMGATNSGYNKFIVPNTVDLFRHLERESGQPMIGPFINMALHGWSSSREAIARWMRVGGNVILLKHALRENGDSEGDAEKMSEIIERQKQDFVVRDIGHAERLVKSYQEAQTQVVLPN
jgi:hypothetical protein